MPKPKALAAMFGTDDEDLPVLPPEDEVISLDDLDDDERTTARTTRDHGHPRRGRSVDLKEVVEKD